MVMASAGYEGAPARRRTRSKGPLREVVASRSREVPRIARHGTPNGRKLVWWLQLTCGHEVERESKAGTRTAREHVHCPFCGDPSPAELP